MNVNGFLDLGVDMFGWIDLNDGMIVWFDGVEWIVW